jgi:hypothetical protein
MPKPEKKLDSSRVDGLVAWLKDVSASQIVITKTKKADGGSDWDVVLTYEPERIQIKD